MITAARRQEAEFLAISMLASWETMEADYFNTQVIEPDGGSHPLGRYRSVEALTQNGISLRIQEYLGPLGAGWMVYAEADGCIRAWDMGPEGRSADWVEVVA